MAVERAPSLRIRACLLVAVIGAPVPADAQEFRSRPLVSDIETIAIERVNEVRTELGLTTLAADPILTAIARAHSRDMLERDYLGHFDPEGAGPAERVGRGHRRLVGDVSENVWSAVVPESRGPAEVAGRIVDAMIASAGHRRNMLAPQLTHLGLGVDSAPSRLGGIEYRATQLFAAVEAYLEDAVPETLTRGRSVVFSPERPDGGRSDIELFDLWSPEEERVVFGPASLVLARLAGVPGRYRLRFYHPVGQDRYAVSSGPYIELE